MNHTKDQGMAKLIKKVPNKVLEAEVAEQLQAEPYEHCESHQGYRNDNRERGLKTRIGTLELAVMRTRRR